MTFAQFLRDKISACDMTQLEIGQVCQLPLITIQSYVNGRRLPSLKIAAMMSRKVGFSLDDAGKCDDVFPVPKKKVSAMTKAARAALAESDGDK